MNKIYVLGITLLLTAVTVIAHPGGHGQLWAEEVKAEMKPAAKGELIRLVAGLDEPEEFYCFDLAGWGKSLKLDDPLQTHTCKRTGGADQMFAFNHGRIEVFGYDRCVAAGGSSGATLPGSAVLARECDDSDMQKFSLEKDGTIKVNGSNYCLGAGSASTEASGPSHMWRTLTVESCDGDAELLRWQVGLD